MKIFKRYLFVYLIFLLVNSGCEVYRSPVAIPSLIKERGEIQANIGTAMPATLYVNADYGITNFISTQVYASYSMPGTIHIDGSAGFYKNFNKLNLGIYGGYVYGQGSFDEVSLMSNSYRWYGNYKIPYGKFQLIYAPYKKFCFGTIVKLGDFNLSYIRFKEEIEEENLNDYMFLNRKSLLIEPSVFCILRFTEKVGLTFSVSNSRLISINDSYFDKSDGNSRIGTANLGIGMVLKFVTKQKKE